jgi:hypothetical protein
MGTTLATSWDQRADGLGMILGRRDQQINARSVTSVVLQNETLISSLCKEEEFILFMFCQTINSRSGTCIHPFGIYSDALL